MIKAIFPAGVTAMTVNGLHQWDYGQKLEIRADDLPTVLELHFSCPGMKEAEVRNCNAPAGVATVSIPDRCLEQSAPITVWVVDIGEDSGTTILGLTLNVTPRLRPASLPGSVQIPESRYNELIAAVNAAVESLKDADVQVNHAKTADEATHAKTADEATHAKTADTVDNVLIAERSKMLLRDDAHQAVEGIGSINMTNLPCGLYHVKVVSATDHLDTGVLLYYYTFYPASACLLQYPKAASTAGGGEFFLGINQGGEQTNILEVFKTTTSTNADGYITSETNKITRPALTLELVTPVH